MLLDIPDDVFLSVRRWPEKDVRGRGAVRFELGRFGRPAREHIYFWTNEYWKGGGLIGLDVLPKVEKLLKSVSEIKL